LGAKDPAGQWRCSYRGHFQKGYRGLQHAKMTVGQYKKISFLPKKLFSPSFLSYRRFSEV